VRLPALSGEGRLPGAARAAINSLPGIRVAGPPGSLPRASLGENAQLNALVVVPNALQGLFRRRRAAVRAATAADVDRWAVRLLRGMRRAHGSPVWVRMATSPALLLLTEDDLRRALDGSPDPFASDPETKRKGMRHFQPDALTISRGADWESRRSFNEAVLATTEEAEPIAGPAAAIATEEIGALRTRIGAGGELHWEPWAEAFARIARRVILGERAAEDVEVSALLAKLMEEANSLPDSESESFGPFMARLQRYVETAEAGSLVTRFGDAPSDERTSPAGQVPHWMFATQDTLAINCFRSLAAIAAHPDARVRAREDGAYLDACLQEAMRLWPTTPMLARELVREIAWNGEIVPKGTQVVISNTFMHRDTDAHPEADRFKPQAWLDGDYTSDWSFNHLSHGPQACAGAALALVIGRAALAEALAADPELTEPRLDPAKPLPHMLDFYACCLTLRRGGQPR
jgi:cytochrome P450